MGGECGGEVSHSKVSMISFDINAFRLSLTTHTYGNNLDMSTPKIYRGLDFWMREMDKKKDRLHFTNILVVQFWKKLR